MKRKLSLFLIAFGAFIVIYPVIFLLAGSFMHPAELEEHLAPIVSPASQGFADWSLLPQIPTLRSYAKVLLEEPQFFMVFWNSVKIVVGVVAGQLLFGVPAAWGFARYEFRLKKLLFFIYIILMMLPFQVIMLSQYLVLRELSLLDSLWAIILPGAFSTFPVFVLYNFFRAIPESIMESARIDGASEFQIFFKIGIPLGKTGIIAVHGAAEGYKLDCMKKDPHVSFSVIGKDDIAKENFTTLFSSVIAFGTIRVIDTMEEKIPVLEAMVGKYSAEFMESGKELIRKGCGSVAYELTIDHMTGKKGML